MPVCLPWSFISDLNWHAVPSPSVGKRWYFMNVLDEDRKFRNNDEGPGQNSEAAKVRFSNHPFLFLIPLSYFLVSSAPDSITPYSPPVAKWNSHGTDPPSHHFFTNIKIALFSMPLLLSQLSSGEQSEEIIFQNHPKILMTSHAFVFLWCLYLAFGI